MSERHMMKPRTCERCGMTESRTAAEVKQHALGCAGDEPVCERCGRPESAMTTIAYAPFCSEACEARA